MMHFMILAGAGEDTQKKERCVAAHRNTNESKMEEKEEGVCRSSIQELEILMRQLFPHCLRRSSISSG